VESTKRACHRNNTSAFISAVPSVQVQNDFQLNAPFCPEFAAKKNPPAACQDFGGNEKTTILDVLSGIFVGVAILLDIQNHRFPSILNTPNPNHAFVLDLDLFILGAFFWEVV
jgi:hypothetical protein